MKNLVKKISAVVTLIAMIASLGVCCFAAEATGAAIVINNYEWSEIVDGVATVTVTYTVSDDTVGALGATMLTFADADDSDTITEDTDYSDDMQIVGIDQGAPMVNNDGVLAPAEADEDGAYPAGTYVFQFPVAVSNTGTSEAGIQLGSGEGAVILIGGDNVTTPGVLLLEAPYTAWDVDSLTWTGADSIDLGDVTVYAETTEAKCAGVATAAVNKLAAIASEYKVTANKGDDVTLDDISLAGLELTATAVAGDGNYVVTVTVPAGTYTDLYKASIDAEEDPTAGGKVVAGKNTFTVVATANVIVDVPKWFVKGDPDLEGGATIGVMLSKEDFAVADAAKVEAVLDVELAGKKVTLNVEKEGEEDSTVVIDVTADMISVTEVVTDGDVKTYIGKVTVAAADGPYTVVGDDDTLTLEEDIEIEIGGTVTNIPVWEVVEEPTIDAIDIALSEVDYVKTGDELKAAIKTALETELVDDELVLDVKKADQESTATVTITADMIAVTEATAGDPMTYAATVTILADEYAVEGADDMLNLATGLVIDVTGTVTEEISFIYGDVNSDTVVDLIDASEIVRKYLSQSVSDGYNAEAADVNLDDIVDLADASMIVRYYLGQETELPVAP